MKPTIAYVFVLLIYTLIPSLYLIIFSNFHFIYFIVTPCLNTKKIIDPYAKNKRKFTILLSIKAISCFIFTFLALPKCPNIFKCSISTLSKGQNSKSKEFCFNSFIARRILLIKNNVHHSVDCFKFTGKTVSTLRGSTPS